MLFRRIWIIMDVCNKSTIGGDLDMKAVALWISTGPFLSEGVWREGRPRFFVAISTRGVGALWFCMVGKSFFRGVASKYLQVSKQDRKKGVWKISLPFSDFWKFCIDFQFDFLCHANTINSCNLWWPPVKLPAAVGQWDGQNGLVGKGPHNLGKVMWRISANICR